MSILGAWHVNPQSDQTWNTAQPSGHHTLKNRKAKYKRFNAEQPVTQQVDSLTSMLDALEWNSLETLPESLCYTKLNTIWWPSIQTSISLLRHHSHNTVSLRYKPFSTFNEYFKFSFFPHTVVLWNALPPDIVSASSLDQFKSQIQTHYI